VSHTLRLRSRLRERVDDPTIAEAPATLKSSLAIQFGYGRFALVEPPPANPWAIPMAHAQVAQSTTCNCGTRPYSRVLVVTMVAPRRRACAAMKPSKEPIGVPFSSSDARISAASRASSPSNAGCSIQIF
jgi:hypothetical protein